MGEDIRWKLRYQNYLKALSDLTSALLVYDETAEPLIKEGIIALAVEFGLYVKVSNFRAINFYLRHGFFIKNYISGQFYMERTVIS